MGLGWEVDVFGISAWGLIFFGEGEGGGVGRGVTLVWLGWIGKESGYGYGRMGWDGMMGRKEGERYG